jgi:hypothetical protein
MLTNLRSVLLTWQILMKPMEHCFIELGGCYSYCSYLLYLIIQC